MSLFIITVSLIITNINGCCDFHISEETCSAETGVDCVWLNDGDERIGVTSSGTLQCVSPKNAQCLAALVANPGMTRTQLCPPPPGVPAPVPGEPPAPSPVSAPESEECAFELCTNDSPKSKYNIQFLLDESRTVGISNYKESIEFIKKLVETDMHLRARVSVYTFSNEVNKIYSFNDIQHKRKGLFNALLNAKKEYQGKCTDTVSALEKGLRDFSICKQIHSDDENYMVLITDGGDCECGPDETGRCETEICGPSGKDIRKKLRDNNIRIFTLGIGLNNIKKLECLSRDSDTFQVDDFTEDDFFRLEEGLRPKLCPIEGPYQIDPVQTFNELSLLIKSMMIIFVVVMIYGIYRYYKNNKYSGYTQLSDNIDQFV